MWRTKIKKINLICSRSPHNVQFGHFACCFVIYNECVVPFFVLFCDVLVGCCSCSCFTVHNICRSSAFRCNAPGQIILLALAKFVRHKEAIFQRPPRKVTEIYQRDEPGTKQLKLVHVEVLVMILPISMVQKFY